MQLRYSLMYHRRSSWQRMSSHESKRVAGLNASSTEPIPAIGVSKAIAATCSGSIPLL